MKAGMDDMLADFEDLTGREFLELLMSRWGAAPFGRQLNMRLIEVGEGSAVFEAFPTPAFLNPQGCVHGGYHASLIDSAMGCAVQSTLGKGAHYGTLELKVNYVRQLMPDVGRILCRGAVIHGGRRISTAEARVEDAAGKLYAHGSGTFMVYEK
jgi:uncharacterized protein (TIGR00369 family)